MRAVLDPNVIISALLSPAGAPARLVQAWLEGHFDLVVSPLLLEELSRALGYPRLRRRIPPEDADALIELLTGSASMAEDPGELPAVTSSDPGDDYLLALASAERAALVSGDSHVLGLSETFPIYAPAGFLALLEIGDQ